MKIKGENLKVTAIIAAAGTGSRMKSNQKKQYMKVNGFPMLWYSLRAFQLSTADSIILVAGAGEREACLEIINGQGFDKVEHIVEGGSERYLSVYAGLESAKGSDYVLIHDAARPLVTASLIDRCIQNVITYKACIAAVPVKDTIKIINENGGISHTPDRKSLMSAQTPQAFSYPLVYDAYRNMMKAPEQEQKNITDDAMIVERYTGHHVQIIEGDDRNFKVTTEADLILAESLLKAAAADQ